MLKGRVSSFGGPGDSGMTPQEGLACYEAHEADLRPDLFYNRSYNPGVGVSKRLRPQAYYFAYRYQLEPRIDRKVLQATQFLFRNPLNNKCVVAHLVDWGPAEWTKRFFDVSPGVLAALDIVTDGEIEGCDISELKTGSEA